MKMATILLCAILVFSFAVPGSCHAPSDISISISGEDVDIAVSHPVGDPAAHYVKAIRLSVNDVVVDAQEFTAQSGNTQKARFHVPGLKKGDVVTVEADCSRYGSISRTQTAGS